MSGPSALSLAAAIEELVLLLIRQRGGLGELEPLALTWTQKLALTLAVDHEPLRLHALAELMDTTNATATRTVDALEAQGLVLRAVDPVDRRAVSISATPRGIQLIEERRRRLVAAIENGLGALSMDDHEHILELADLLAALNRLFEAGPATAAASAAP